ASPCQLLLRKMSEITANLTQEIERNMTAALAEDVAGGDLTAQLAPDIPDARAHVVCREAAVLCGTAWFEACLLRLDPAARLQWHVRDGARIAAGTRICDISGSSRALLTAERTALNFLQLLSATATTTRRYVDLVAGTG